MIAPSSEDITGLVLCGGRGSRMGGADKGLVVLHDQPLVAHAVARLKNQVGLVALNANRNLDRYARLGLPVWPDEALAGVPPQPGPLAGWWVGLRQARTPYLLTVPCDAPHLPLDLAPRLALALAQSGAVMAVAATPAPGGVQVQPVFALMKTSLHAELLAYLQAGGRKALTWVLQQQAVQVLFEDAAAFSNINSPADLAALHST
jgi:molybdenum cofactor guanylyltransferase